jgi:tetratricopeptide (TPR) repeat protein
VWPARLGAVPPLAGGFTARPQTAPDLLAELVPGATVLLVPDQAGAAGTPNWAQVSGKTQLAAGTAESLWLSRQIELLVWVTATSRASVLSGYAEAAAVTLGAGSADGAEAAAARFASWLAAADRPWLVVLDDLSGPADLAGLWPAGPAGRVLITARDPGAAAGHHARVVAAGAFSQDEALAYLASRLTPDPGQDHEAAALAAELGRGPLALAQASAVITRSGWSCRDYLSSFGCRRDELAGAAGARPTAAEVTWVLCTDQADRLAPAGSARPLLALAALLDGHAIPAQVFSTPAICAYLAGEGATEPVPPELARTALQAAEQAGLVSTGPVSTRPVSTRPVSTATVVRMSAPVQAAIRAAMPAPALERAAPAAAEALLQVWPGGEQPAWLGMMLRASAASLQRAAGDVLWAGACHPLLLRAGRSLDEAGLTGPAVGYWAELAEAGRRVLGRSHPDTLEAAERLAGAYLAAGQAAQAVSSFEWLLTERVRVHGPAHPGAINARRNLGQALAAANRFADAIAALDRVAGDYERVRGADHTDTLAARDELAAAQLTAGRAADAVRLRQSTVITRERVQGPLHPDTMTTRLRLAEAYLADGRAKTALSLYKQVLAEREQALGADHIDTIATRSALGSAYYGAGRMASAIDLHEQAQAGYARVLGAGHPDTLASNLNLAEAYHAVGRVTDAATLLRATLAHCEQAGPAADRLAKAARARLAEVSGQ